ncbi:monovalent cation/H(+) antiporter subunit G [Ahrensia marina]|uniref:Cation:proton antiporter n=1 Tax=Ahrensia marina TaxID=1514904 RepID=A0A0M9GNT2_9HYPH|nr:monovalent cation/H(+) antiporter subunit G [Ahrensia marina]KPB02257.1 cation:proton antiporter [Ahrensia marina]
MIDGLADIIAGLMIIAGSTFAFLAAVGLWRLPDIYTRMHSASKTGTVGSGLLLLALAAHVGDTSTVTRALAGVVFFLLTAPISAHLLAKVSYAVGYRLTDISVVDELKK